MNDLQQYHSQQSEISALNSELKELELIIDKLRIKLDKSQEKNKQLKAKNKRIGSLSAKSLRKRKALKLLERLHNGEFMRLKDIAIKCNLSYSTIKNYSCELNAGISR